MVLKKAVILKIYYMPNSPTSQIHKKNPPNFHKCWGKMKNDPSLGEKFCKKILKSEQIGKRLLPGSGETDCRISPSTIFRYGGGGGLLPR